VLVLHPPQGSPTPVATPPAYLVGAWVSDSMPPPDGTVQVYVRVTNSATLAPVAGAKVTLQVLITCAAPSRVAPYGPAVTQSDGVATITVTFSGLPVAQPVCVTATVTVGGQTYTTDTEFAAS
jgi:hypothetical protein